MHEPSGQSTSITDGLRTLLDLHINKRVLVVGTTCTGKTTIVSHIPGARDQDREVFPKLTKAESDYVCQVPWTPEIGATMTRLVREKVLTEVGRPLFGTVVVDCDLIILLKISDELLLSRVGKRGVKFVDAKNMQLHLEKEVRDRGVPWIEYRVD